MASALTEHSEQVIAQWAVMDQVELRLGELGASRAGKGGTPEGCPVKHHFTPGMYSREIFMPKGQVVVSKVHKTEHQFVISSGCCAIYTDSGEWVPMEAPYHGITVPGTRRLLVMLEDTVWTTFHVNPDNLTDPVELEEKIIQEYENPLLGGPT